MTRLLLILFVLFAAPCWAAKLNPPLTGDMTSLEVYDTPKELHEAMLSRAPEGLSYLSENKGQVVLLNLWATWCPPCVTELPSLNALQHAMGSPDFKVVTISLDQGDPQLVKKFMTDQKLDQLPAYIDANGDMQRMDVLKDVPGIPVSLILDRQMRVVARLQGSADWNGRSARAVLEYYLKNLPNAFTPSP